MNTMQNATGHLTFAQLAAALLDSTDRTLVRTRTEALRAGTLYASEWNLRTVVIAEAERELYADAVQHGEAAFVQSVARGFNTSHTCTDAFNRAAAEARVTAAHRALGNLRAELTTEAKLALVDLL